MASSTQDLARSARSVARECRVLLASLETDGHAEPALVERLEVVAREWTDDDGDDHGFAAAPGDDGDDAPQDADALLSRALADLSVGNALLAAAEAVGTDGAPPTAHLRDTVAALDGVSGLLDEQDGGGAASHGFAPAPRSADVDEALDRLRHELDATLDAVTDSSVAVVTDALAKAQERAPQQVRDLVTTIGERLQLGEYAHRFARLGAKAVEKALDVLTRIIPASFLRSARDDVHVLVERLQAGEPAPAVVGWVFGVDGVRGALAALVPQGTPDVERADRASAELVAIRERFAGMTKLAKAVVAGIVTAAGLLALFAAGVPHVAVVTSAALLVVVAAVLVLGLDFTDGRPGPGVVVGARTIVVRAWSAP